MKGVKGPPPWVDEAVRLREHGLSLKRILYHLSQSYDIKYTTTINYWVKSEKHRERHRARMADYHKRTRHLKPPQSPIRKKQMKAAREEAKERDVPVQQIWKEWKL